jgi:membrane protein required for colicin V production
MSFQLLDLILIGIMLISGLLALMRGFTREVLSLVAWGGAALIAYYLTFRQQALVDLVLPYIANPKLAQGVAAVAVFLVALIVFSIISVKLADTVVDSAVGAFDRSLGLIFGLARGFVFITICYLFYGWLLKEDQREPWVRNAASRPYIIAMGNFIADFLPADIAETLRTTALDTSTTNSTAAGTDPAKPESGAVQPSEQQGLDNLIEGQSGQGAGQKPIFGQGEQQ